MRTRGLQKKSGSDLLSRAVSRGVPSALEGLTSVFGMGTGVTPPTLPPENKRQCIQRVVSILLREAGAFFRARRRYVERARGLDLGLESLTPPFTVELVRD